MAWIELHQAVWTHRKTFELAAILGLDETYAAAHVIRLWGWALDNAPSGDLSGLSDRVVSFGAGWKGGAGLFVAALVEAGWLDQNRAIHDWAEYAGRLVARREENAERMRLARSRRSGALNAANTSGERAAHVQGLPDTTQPNTTVPDPSPPTPSPHGGEGNGATAPTSNTKRPVAQPKPRSAWSDFKGRHGVHTAATEPEP